MNPKANGIKNLDIHMKYHPNQIYNVSSSPNNQSPYIHHHKQFSDYQLISPGQNKNEKIIHRSIKRNFDPQGNAIITTKIVREIDYDDNNNNFNSNSIMNIRPKAINNSFQINNEHENEMLRYSNYSNNDEQGNVSAIYTNKNYGYNIISPNTYETHENKYTKINNYSVSGMESDGGREFYSTYRSPGTGKIMNLKNNDISPVLPNYTSGSDYDDVNFPHSMIQNSGKYKYNPKNNINYSQVIGLNKPQKKRYNLESPYTQNNDFESPDRNYDYNSSYFRNIPVEKIKGITPIYQDKMRNNQIETSGEYERTSVLNRQKWKNQNQKYYRPYSDKNDIYNIINEKATQIQSFVRGFLVRKKVLRYITLAIYYQSFCDKLQDLLCWHVRDEVFNILKNKLGNKNYNPKNKRGNNKDYSLNSNKKINQNDNNIVNTLSQSYKYISKGTYSNNRDINKIRSLNDDNINFSKGYDAYKRNKITTQRDYNEIYDPQPTKTIKREYSENVIYNKKNKNKRPVNYICKKNNLNYTVNYTNTEYKKIDYSISPTKKVTHYFISSPCSHNKPHNRFYQEIDGKNTTNSNYFRNNLNTYRSYRDMKDIKKFKNYDKTDFYKYKYENNTSTTFQDKPDYRSGIGTRSYSLGIVKTTYSSSNQNTEKCHCLDDYKKRNINTEVNYDIERERRVDEYNIRRERDIHTHKQLRRQKETNIHRFNNDEIESDNYISLNIVKIPHRRGNSQDQREEIYSKTVETKEYVEDKTRKVEEPVKKSKRFSKIEIGKQENVKILNEGKSKSVSTRDIFTNTGTEPNTISKMETFKIVSKKKDEQPKIDTQKVEIEIEKRVKELIEIEKKEIERMDQERKNRERRDRLEQEKRDKEREKRDKERRDKEELLLIEREKKITEEMQRIEREKRDIERREKEAERRREKDEEDRKNWEEQERIEKEKRLKEEQNRKDRERKDRERRDKLDKERREREKKEMEEQLIIEREKIIKIETERLEKEMRERERKEKEKRLKKEREDKLRREQEEKERLEREKKLEEERKERERKDKERIEQLEREKRERERKEREEQLRIEREKRKKEEQDRIERERREKERKEREEKLRKEREDKIRKEKLEQERIEREKKYKLEQERREKERKDKERKDKLEKERLEREKKEEQLRIERQRKMEQERIERERREAQKKKDESKKMQEKLKIIDKERIERLEMYEKERKERLEKRLKDKQKQERVGGQMTTTTKTTVTTKKYISHKTETDKNKGTSNTKIITSSYKPNITTIKVKEEGGGKYPSFGPNGEYILKKDCQKNLNEMKLKLEKEYEKRIEMEKKRGQEELRLNQENIEKKNRKEIERLIEMHKQQDSQRLKEIERIKEIQSKKEIEFEKLKEKEMKMGIQIETERQKELQRQREIEEKNKKNNYMRMKKEIELNLKTNENDRKVYQEKQVVTKNREEDILRAKEILRIFILSRAEPITIKRKYFNVWRRKARYLELLENSKIIQEFCRANLEMTKIKKIINNWRNLSRKLFYKTRIKILKMKPRVLRGNIKRKKLYELIRITKLNTIFSRRRFIHFIILIWHIYAKNIHRKRVNMKYLYENLLKTYMSLANDIFGNNQFENPSVQDAMYEAVNTNKFITLIPDDVPLARKHYESMKKMKSADNKDKGIYYKGNKTDKSTTITKVEVETKEINKKYYMGKINENKDENYADNDNDDYDREEAKRRKLNFLARYLKNRSYNKDTDKKQNYSYTAGIDKNESIEKKNISSVYDSSKKDVNQGKILYGNKFGKNYDSKVDKTKEIKKPEEYKYTYNKYNNITTYSKTEGNVDNKNGTKTFGEVDSKTKYQYNVNINRNKSDDKDDKRSNASSYTNEYISNKSIDNKKKDGGKYTSKYGSKVSVIYSSNLNQNNNNNISNTSSIRTDKNYSYTDKNDNKYKNYYSTQSQKKQSTTVIKPSAYDTYQKNEYVKTTTQEPKYYSKKIEIKTTTTSGNISNNYNYSYNSNNKDDSSSKYKYGSVGKYNDNNKQLYKSNTEGKMIYPYKSPHYKSGDKSDGNKYGKSIETKIVKTTTQIKPYSTTVDTQTQGSKKVTSITKTYKSSRYNQ